MDWRRYIGGFNSCSSYGFYVFPFSSLSCVALLDFFCLFLTVLSKNNMEFKERKNMVTYYRLKTFAKLVV
jgi:hypothetical protein